jgi:hypothetical protein
MIHSLQLFIVLNASVCVTVISLVAGLAIGALVYGRRHEQRTRDRGSLP